MKCNREHRGARAELESSPGFDPGARLVSALAACYVTLDGARFFWEHELPDGSHDRRPATPSWAMETECMAGLDVPALLEGELAALVDDGALREG